MRFLTLTIWFLALSAMPALAGASQQAQTEKFTLPALPYAYSAVAPAISADTMETHHSKHHQAYVDNLNKEVEKTPSLQGKTLEDILTHISAQNDAVRNNAGGHWNHSFFWPLMAPEGQRGEISPEFKTALEQKFGSVESFKEEFQKAGAARFGSGWVWLIVNKDGTLEITSTANQDNPLMDNAVVKGKPVLGNDVWEHAYYLDYKNKRGDYLGKWWDVLNWKQASDNYAAAIRK